MKFDDLRVWFFKEVERSVCEMLMMGMIFLWLEKFFIYFLESSFDLMFLKFCLVMFLCRIFNKVLG